MNTSGQCFDEDLQAPTKAVKNQEEIIQAMRTEGAECVAWYHARLRLREAKLGLKGMMTQT